MKTSAILLIAFITGSIILANESEGQALNEVSVSLEHKNIEVKKVFDILHKETNFNFLYRLKDVRSAGKVSLDKSKENLEELLYEISKQTGLSFKRVDDNIFVKLKEKQEGVVENAKTLFDKKITGKVTDAETGEPLIGANVYIDGTNIGTVTDVDGNYSIELPEDAALLIISYVGYLTREIPIGGRSVIDISLSEDVRLLDEIVVVGYGTQKKINLTGAVSQISSEDIENRPAPNLTRMLQGILPNLNIKMIDGSPTRSAEYNIRGMTSIGAGGNALILIDGVEGDPNLLNPKDVESVTILKDAASAAIYGSRAAFGVVLITTKSAKEGQSSLNIDVSQSVNQRTVEPNLVTDGYEWAKNFDEAFLGWFDYQTRATTVNTIHPFSGEYLNELKRRSENPDLPDVIYNEELDRYEYYGSTDWDNLLHKKNMPTTEVSMNISGGSEKASFYLSGLYYYQDGIFNYSSDKFNKYNIRGKGDISLTEWLSFQNNFDLSNYTYEYPLLANGDINVWRYLDVVGFPIGVMNNPDGSYTRAAAFTGAPFFEGTSRSKQSNFLIRNTSSLKADFFNDLLTFKADFSFFQNTEKDKRTNNYLEYSEKPGSSSRFGQSLLRAYNTDKFFWSSNITSEMKKTFRNSHNVQLLTGFNIENSSLESLNTSRNGLLVSSKPDYNLLDGLNYSITGGGSEWAFIGVFYRANYNFKNKYLVELNGRYDGSSKFPIDQRFGFFPSASIGWNIAEEVFMENTRDWLNNLKIRASYGSLGNGNVAPYRYLELMSVRKTGVILEDIQKTYTNLPGVIPDGITWETSTTFNLGLDASLFNNKFGLIFEWYDRQTTDMFTFGQPLPNVFGATVPFGNYADLSTKGWELTLSWKDQVTLANKPFIYNISGSVWDSKSFITKFNNPTKALESTYYEGHQIGEIWGYETLGLFTSEEEIDNHADQSFLQNSNNNVWLPGDIKFADLNNDGFINIGDNTVDNPGDRKIIGNNAPRYHFGVNLSSSWNGIGLSFFFQGIGKRDWYFAPEADLFYGPYNRPYGFQPKIMMDNIWTEENQDAYWPRFRGYNSLGTTRSLGAPQTRYLQDASYIRLKNITLDYAFSNKIIESLNLQKARIFVTGQNLLTFSGLFKNTDNYDPEVIENPSNWDETNGFGQGNAYPMLKTVTVGLNLSF